MFEHFLDRRLLFNEAWKENPYKNTNPHNFISILLQLSSSWNGSTNTKTPEEEEDEESKAT